MHFNIYAIPNLVVSAYSLFLSVFIILKNRKALINKLVFVFCVIIFIWLASYACVYMSDVEKNALFFSKIGHLPVIIYAPLFYYICILLTNKKKEFKYFIFAVIIDFFLLLVLFPTNLYLSGVKKYFWGYYPIGGPLISVEIFVLLIFVVRGNWLLYVTYKYNPDKLPTATLNKLKYFMLAFVVFIFCIFDFMQKYSIAIYPFGFIFATIFLSIISYAIFKHQLLDINIVFRKGLIYSILLSVITISYFAVALLSENVFRKFIGYKSSLLTFFIIIVFILIFQPLKNKIQHLVDKYFFKGSIDQIEQENLRLREELQRSEKLKAVGTLAAGMAHEIKNPLTSIKTFTEYLPKKYQDKEFIDKFNKIVGSEVNKINDIVTQLLDFAKPRPLELKESNIQKLINETIEFLNNNFIKHHIGIEKHYDCSPTIKVDPAQIKQVFLNIILNAVEAMKDKGGKLTIGIKQSINDSIEISIADTGCGIDEKDLKHLFDPFFSTKETNTGLGLSIVHGIIEKHKGKIEVTSSIHQGTLFTLILPNS